MKIAQDWKIVEHLVEKGQVVVKTKNLGHYTEATAKEKMMVLYPNHWFAVKPNHGFGGYWVNLAGETAQCIPGKA